LRIVRSTRVKFAKEASKLEEAERKKAVRETDKLDEEARRRRARELAVGEDVRLSVRTPLEKYKETVIGLKGVLQSGAMSQETFTRAVGRARDALTEASQAATGAGAAMAGARTSLVGRAAMASAGRQAFTQLFPEAGALGPVAGVAGLAAVTPGAISGPVLAGIAALTIATSIAEARREQHKMITQVTWWY